MTELDKFKRRTIRSVARLLQQKKPPDELWAEMKKETGSDCRVLWERMRALCIKKLTRMLAVDDRSDLLPSIARLSLTDWLLVDLVLVHEKIDVIAMEKGEGRQEPKPLVELFNLVQRFEVEGRSGEPLACAWAAATVHYNRQGRQCSPMLLQRRWHQLKKVTRSRFYHFWQAYRGNNRLLVDARQTMPTHLQMAVAKCYPEVITKEFPDWEELIKERLVILPEEFESKMRVTKRPKPSSSNDPDLVVVEPVIETIDLDIETDSEEPKDDQIEDGSDPEKSNDATTDLDPIIAEETAINNEFLGVKIKSEPVEEEDGLSNVQVVATSHVPEVEIDDDSPGPHPHTAPSSQTPANQAIIEDEYEDDVIEMPRAIPTITIDESPKKKETEISNDEMVPIIGSEPNDLVSVSDEDAVVDDIIKIKADEFCSNPSEIPKMASMNLVMDDLIKAKADTFLNTPKEDISFDEKKPDISTINATTIDLMADLNFIDDGIEFVDDGIEFEEEEDEASDMIESVSKTDHPNEKESQENKFDLKLLMEPVVYTTKLDKMNIFINKPFDSVQSKEDIKRVVEESKPVSKKSFNINIKPEDSSSQNDNSGVHDDVGINDDLFTNQEESDEEIDEYATVSINSNLLKKPKSRRYNPILLCKNPDFNTKLRRLNIGFFSSIRNRQLLNACIPMTIDVSKSFESKLVNGTLYLKPTDSSQKLVQTKVINNQTSSVAPSAMHVQTLMDNSKKDIHELIPIQPTKVIPDSVISERTKTINLPDIDKVRRINQQLLTAQVPPIRVYSGDSCRIPTPTVQAIDMNKVDEIKLSEPHAEPIAAVPTITVPETMPTVVKVENEAYLDSKSIPPDPGTIVPPENLPPARKKLLKIINQAKILTQEALTKIDRETKKKVTEVPKKVLEKPKESQVPIKIPEKKKPVYNRVPVPWTPKYVQKPDSIDDFLITDDTLNKMLHLMSGEKNVKTCSCCSSKQKKAEVKKQNKLKKKIREAKYSDNDSTIPDSVQDSSDNSNSAQDLSQPLRIGTNPKPVLARGRVVRYCCWARQKISNRKRITKHTCPLYQCECCCRDELTKLLQKSKTKDIIAIEVSDDEEKSLKKACESIENVVQQSRELTQSNTILQLEESFTPVKTVVAVQKISTSTSTDMETNTDSSEMLNQAVINASPRKISDLPQQPIVITKVVPRNKLTSPQKKPMPQSKVAYAEPQLTSTIKCVPCSCQTPAVSQGKRRNIVIDASKKCPLHPAPIAPKNEKILYLHSKSIAKSPSESPIFLGKNKILLTTVKFPREDDVLSEECEMVQPPKIIPTLPLPTGVQLVLLPSGVVTYTTEQGTELSEDQLATLPTIIAAVQEQLDTPPAISLKKDSDITSSDIQSVVNVPQFEENNVVQTATVSETISLDIHEKFQDVDIPKSENLKKDSTTPTATSVAPIPTEKTQRIPNILQPIPVNPSTSKEDGHAETGETLNSELDNRDAVVLNDDPTISETSKVGQTELPKDKQNLGNQTNVENSEGINKSGDKEATANRKSLLSDLMEMSGISAEDTTASEQSAAEQAVPEIQSPNTNCIMVNADQARNLPELSPVTSFAELKYACENNGKFFKLDFETGIIVPINVCIKKNPKPKAPPLKAVIDLTDDIEDSNGITKEADPQIPPKVNQESPTNSLLKSHVQYTYKGKTVKVSDTVKPIKLFKALHQPEPTNQKNMTVLSLTLKKTHLEKRQHIFNKIEAKIDLVDSDAPMEEEYLMDSSEDENSQTESMPVEALDMDALNESESSDDEPLAKKSKRMKESIAEKESKGKDLETNIRLALDHLNEDIPDLEHNRSEVTDDATQDAVVPMDSEEPPGGAEDNESEIGAQPVLRFMSVSDNEGGEEDCILGV